MAAAGLTFVSPFLNILETYIIVPLVDLHHSHTVTMINCFLQ
jgi:hypothetical protein